MRVLALGRFLCTLALFGSGCSDPEVQPWQKSASYRIRPLQPQEGRGIGYSPVEREIQFANSLSDSAFLDNRHLVNGSGVAIGDIDQDGWPDILFAALEGRSVIYRNVGQWQFEDITDQSGLAGINPYATGATLADVNGDGHLDALTTSLGGGIQLFLNDGRGRFTDVSAESGLSQQGGATTMALADIDGDRDLDLYVGYYKTATAKDLFAPSEIAFDRVVRQEADSFFVDDSMKDHYRVVRQGNRLMRVELAEPDELYLNNGTGAFALVDWMDGSFLDEGEDRLVDVPRDWALTARFQDINGDGLPDLFVCNDFESPDHIWLGNGQGQFKAAHGLAIRQTSQSTMSVAIADVNADGHVDMFLADMLSRNYRRRQRQHQVIPPELTTMGDLETRIQVMQNMLLIGRGDGSFAETARFAGVAATEWTWSSAFVDVDLDGYQDLLLTTGHAYDAMDADAQIRAQRATASRRNLLLGFPDLDLPNMAFHNQGDGTFVLKPDGWGLGLSADVAHGLATGDFDLDGDMDVVFSRLNGRAGLFRNDADAPRIAVQLSGQSGNAYGIGAQLRVFAPGLPDQQHEIVAGGNYLSSSEALASFAWSEGAKLEVRWRSGQVQSIENLQSGHLYEVIESDTNTSIEASVDIEAALFTDWPLDLSHSEHPYDDFAVQPLLPRRLSQRGPALAAFDIDRNGYEDLILGSGRGGRLQYALNFGGQFGRGQEFGPPAAGDHSGVIVVPPIQGSTPSVMAAVSNYEWALDLATDSAWIEVYSAPLGESLQRVPYGVDAPGPMVLADFTGDGELELFVGGHFRRGRYPEPASSRVFRKGADRWQPDYVLSAPLSDLGLVSGATASDFNGDGLADLALADGLGPIRIFMNRGEGQLAEMTRSLGLAAYPGWWNGVATGDFDADGRLDLLATNRGLNLYHGDPIRLYYGDLDGNGNVDIIETRYESELGGHGFLRDLPTLLNALPPMAQRIQSYQHFASQTVGQIMGSALQNLASIDVETSAVTVFLNRGDTFEALPLADAAQLTIAHGAVVADFDGDGAEDVFLSQNEFALPPSTPRLDSGLGLMLLGRNNGQLEPISSNASGIIVHGAQRAAVAADFDRDGRSDLAVTQNAGPVALFRNVNGVAGITVFLTGPAGNPSAIGASVRLEYADGTQGPIRYIAAGSGYWSQNSFTPILGLGGQATHVWVRWPGGSETRVPIEEDAQRVRITYEH